MSTQELSMEFDNTPDGGSSQPKVTRLRTGMFSAEDGFMLAVFFAVVVLVALLIRCICIRWCHVKCPNCQHKQDPASHDDTLSAVVVGNSRRQSQPSSQQHQFRLAEPELIDAALLERAFGVDPNNSNACTLAASSSDGATCNSLSDEDSEVGKTRPDPCHSCRRGRRVSSVPPSSMETLFEEEEGEDPQPPTSKMFLAGVSRVQPRETGVVYTIYTFPHSNSSPEVLRTSTTVVKSMASRAREEAARGEAQVPSTSSNSSGKPSDFDLPSYDELFPRPRSSEKNHLQSRDPNDK